MVRLATPERHIEVHEPGKLRQIKRIGEILTAPGILRNPVPVEAMWDGDVANAMTLRNLLNRAGYETSTPFARRVSRKASRRVWSKASRRG